MTNQNGPTLDLYKKYRPRTWDEVIGQDRIVDSLKKTVVSNRVPGAIGFFGPAGTGKTSVARILAKAVNCEGRAADDPNPCNECSKCLAIDSDTQMGFHYLSMANEGTTEQVREITRKAWLNQPLKRQVWILDEIHDIHAKAFDALLIPVESETLPSTFIMCSTAPNSVPKTVLSRMPSRHFRPVGADDLKKLLETICEKEGIETTDSAIHAAIANGGGSVRDTITSFESILETGEESYSQVSELIESLSKYDTAQALAIAAKLEHDGASLKGVISDVIAGLRNLLLAISGVSRDVYGVLPVANPKEVAIGLRGRQGIVYCIEELGTALASLSRGVESRIALDVSIVKITNKLGKRNGGK